MRSWSRSTEAREPDDESGSTRDPPAPVWVSHTPTPDNVSEDVKDADDSTGRKSSTPPFTCKEENDAKTGSLRDKLKSLLPHSFLQRWTRDDDDEDSEPGATGIQILPNGTRVSPPVSPLLDRKNWTWQSESSQNSQKPLVRESPPPPLYDGVPAEESVLSSIHAAEQYAQKLEVYQQKYSYLKSWPGLLRLLAGLQLLFGGMALACVIAYVQKDSEWSNSYGLYNGAFNNGLGVSGYSYAGPMTPFVLAVVGLAWIVTFCLLVVGMTMYYRTILLDSPWWPLTEAFINVAMFLLYMAAGIVYLNDLNRGGLCFMTVGVNPIMANLCRVDGGQMAGTAFVFINMAMYLGGFLVCLKMWRHEAARRLRRDFGDQVSVCHMRRRLQEVTPVSNWSAAASETTETEEKSNRKEQHQEFHESVPLARPKVKRISFKDEPDTSHNKHPNTAAPPPGVNKRSAGPQGNRTSVPEAYIIPDYIMKYPSISCVEEREKYKAVFNDQYQEYKELHRDVSATLAKFRELDAMMDRLLREGRGHQDRHRIQSVLKQYQLKKSDSGFLEKKERCDYLKAKLSHIKLRIRTFDLEESDMGRK